MTRTDGPDMQNAQNPQKIFDLESYDYCLPERQIAQTPAVPRDAARLLVWSVSGGAGGVEHRVFSDLESCLRPGDLLVLNDTRVLPARIYGKRTPGGGNAEILLLSPLSEKFDLWRVLARPGRRLGVGAEVTAGGRVLRIVGAEDDGVKIARVGTDREDVLAFLDEHGTMPLPPYIKNIKDADSSRERARRDYQTVYALRDGSAAAPTAGLHFTEELLRRVEERGVETARVTLHVGLGTFRPVKASDIRRHVIHSERCEVSRQAADAVARCKARGGRVVAVGTTVVRTLESMAEGGAVKPGSADTKLFIYPGFEFKAADALITNFHLPKSSLLMLTAAFVNHLAGGRKEEEALSSLMEIYSLAVSGGYRFFSFGDAMFIEK